MTETPVGTFFSQPNEINLETLPSDLAQLVDLLRSRLEPGRFRTLLPARLAGGTRWYGMAPSGREARLIREELRSWLGEPVSVRIVDVRGSIDVMDVAASRLVPGGTVLRVDVAPGWENEARSNVASLTDIWSIAPERGIDQPRPVGRVLRQFYESVLGDDRALAQDALDELKARSLLSATNLRFLKLELLSALGTAQEIRDEPSLRGISLLARPPAVTERLAEVADALVIAPAITANTTADEWMAVGKDLGDAWPALVTDLHQVTTLATARCFALAEMVSAEPREAPVRQLVDRFPIDPVVRVAADSMSSAGSAAPPPASALDLYHSGNYAAALTLAESLPRDRSAATVALAAAINLADSGSAVRAIAIVHQLSDAERAQILGVAVERAFYEQLRARTSERRVPEGWLGWLAEDWADRPDLLAEWSRDWPRSSADLEALSEPLAQGLLDALNDGRRARVRNGVPVLVDWLVGDGLPASGVSLSVTVVDILLSSEPGRTERQAALTLLDELLSVGCSTTEYRELVAALSRQLPAVGPRDAWWLVQCLDLLLLTACPDPSTRQRLFGQALSTVTAWGDRLETSEVTLLGHVFSGAGMEFSAPSRRDDAGAEEPASRTFRLVGMYSLLEGATQVAAAWISERWPDVEVRISSGEVNSASLSALARGADVMLVQTSHAKHAATSAITSAAVDPTKLVLVHGRGATALLRGLIEWSARTI